MNLGTDLIYTTDYAHELFRVCIVLFRHRPCERLIPRPGNTTNFIVLKINCTESVYSMFSDKIQNSPLNQFKKIYIYTMTVVKRK